MRGLRHPSRALILAGLALALAAPGCGDDDDSGNGGSGGRTLDVGLSFTPGLDDAADRVAFDRLEQATDIHPVFTESGGPPNTAAGIVRGDFDIGSTSLLSAIAATQQGADIKVILGAAMTVDFFVVGRGDLDELSDLEGKRIAHGEPGGQSEFMAKVAVAEAGVDADLLVVDDAAQRMAALVGGKVDAIVLEFPDLKLLEAREDDITTVASLREIAPFLMADVFVVKGEFAEENPELVEQVVHGMLDGYEFIRTPEGRKAWLEEARGSAEDEEASVLEEVYERQKATGYWPRRAEPVTRERHDRAVAFWREADYLEGDAPFEDVWEIPFWESAGG